MHQTVPCW